MITSIELAAEKKYDYIICGGGTSGLVLASRLTEDPAVSVLVVEAGEANLDDAMLLRPGSQGHHFGNPSYDWMHKTVPQEHVQGREFIWSRGKGLGGSSGINFYLYTKPSRRELDDLETLGNTGWSWDEINKYMHKSERFTHPTDDWTTKHKLKLEHWKTGTDGPISTAFPTKVFAAEMELQQTLINAGLSLALDPLGGDNNGVFFVPNTIDPTTKMRTYATPAYYLPHAHRKNLTVAVSSLVKDVTIEHQGDQLLATGIKATSGGGEHVLRANKEVIISAGAIKTPQLLELSGIGDKTVLEKAGIPVKLDLPSVGNNVQEHIFSFICWELKDDVALETCDLLRDPAVAAENLELLKKGEGLFTLGSMGLAFTTLQKVSPDYERLNASIKECIMAKADTLAPGLKAQYDVMLSRIDDSVPSCEFMCFPGCMLPTLPDPTKKYITIGFALNHPWIRGSIHINSSDHTADPVMDPRYFVEDYDRAVFIEMAKWVRTLAEIAPLKDIITTEAFPGPQFQDDAALEGFLKQAFTTTWHTCGSASMLPRDKGGVVAPDLKVYGTSNLRVVDLSILPLHMATHTVAFVYAMAEKASDIIKAGA